MTLSCLLDQNLVHMAIPIRREGWVVSSLFWAAICPTKDSITVPEEETGFWGSLPAIAANINNPN